MTEKIIVPSLGESINEATVSKWLKNKGDQVEADEPLVELETDKVNLEVPAPVKGILSDIKYQNGATVQVGAFLGLIDTDKKIASNYKSKQKIFKNKKVKDINKNEEPLVLNEIEKSKETNETEPLILNNEAIKPINDLKKEQTILSPAVRKIVQENNIDILKVKGTGKDGRVLKSDLIGMMGKSPEPSERKIKYGLEERIKMTRLRLTIAKRLKEAQENAAMLTTFNEVDMQQIIEMRKEYQEDFQDRFSIKLGFMSFFVKACIVALKNYPAINAEISNDEIVYKNYYNISFAVGTERGLVVPVLKNADEMSFAEIEKNIKLMSEKANRGKLSIEDLQGGTFTISNGGVYGSMLSTPILNPPQSGVLGMHNIVERAVIKDGKIVIRPVMYLALSYDHRIVDGKESVSFLKSVKEHLEDPRRLFLKL